MHLDEIKRGLRAEIKKRENEQYFTCQTNIRQMCKDVLAKIEEQESMLAEKDKELRRHKYKRCLAMANYCQAMLGQFPSFGTISEKENWWDKWGERWLSIADKFKEAK